MGAAVGHLLRILDGFFPPALAEPWDRARVLSNANPNAEISVSRIPTDPFTG